MTRSIREAKESPLPQGVDERIAYILTTTPWGSSPGTLSCALKTIPGLVDVSASKLSGSTTAVGDVITSPIVYALNSGQQYRLEFKFTCSANVFEAYLILRGEE
jgi:hypothetical protein